MASKEEYLQAAKTQPKDRTTAQQALVDDAKRSGMTDVNNAAVQAENNQRYNW